MMKKAPLSGAFFFIFVTQSSAFCKGVELVLCWNTPQQKQNKYGEGHQFLFMVLIVERTF